MVQKIAEFPAFEGDLGTISWANLVTLAAEGNYWTIFSDPKMVARQGAHISHTAL